MKQSYKILGLTGTVICVIIFWLAPGINKSTAKRYTRVFENTYVKEPVHHSDTLKASSSKMKTKKKKKYLKESIEADIKWKEVNPKMFSRAGHFEEEMLLVHDSVIEITEIDSTKVAYDSLVRL